jgi:ABC-type nickel/cobalt efflux system permease component RcnA
VLSADTALLSTAAVLGVVHTILGPDHYVPFVAMGKARGWSLRRTLGITTVCGVGHIVGSVALGAIGIGAGWAIAGVEGVEGFRGNVAGWLLAGFGLAYLAWGLNKAYRNRPHSHWHTHGDGTVHLHQHTHADEHAHAHTGTDTMNKAKPRSITPWVLFTIFVFGPCEPLIPLLMYPAATSGWASVAAVTAVFAASTLAVMLVAVAIARQGLERFAAVLPLRRLERYADAAAGAAVLLCGVAVTLGL